MPVGSWLSLSRLNQLAPIRAPAAQPPVLLPGVFTHYPVGQQRIDVGHLLPWFALSPALQQIARVPFAHVAPAADTAVRAGQLSAAGMLASLLRSARKRFDLWSQARRLLISG
jgi:hypothetical protein